MSNAEEVRPPETVNCSIVDDGVFIVRVSERKFRVAKFTQTGGYSRMDATKLGLCNVRRAEFLSAPLSLQEAQSELHNYTHPGTYTFYDPVIKNEHGINVYKEANSRRGDPIQVEARS